MRGKRIIKKYWILFLVFLTLNIFFISILTNIFEIEKKYKVSNSLLSDKSKGLMMMSGVKISNKEYLKILEGNKFVIEGDIQGKREDKDTIVKGIFYNYEINKTYPLEEGRMFSLEEMNNGEKVALIGKELKDREKDGFVYINNEKYKIIGILDESLSNTIYINFNGLEYPLNMINISIDEVDGNTSSMVIESVEKLKETKNIESMIKDVYGNGNSLNAAISENSVHIILGVLISICLIGTVINISSYWIEKEKGIIGVKCLVGGNKENIIRGTWFEYEGVIFTSLLIGVIIYSFFNRIYEMDYIVKAIGVLSIINVFTSTIAIVPSIIKIKKLNINSIIKENI
ncbi:MAG: ABC transporter permease [Clostridium sp.]